MSISEHVAQGHDERARAVGPGPCRARAGAAWPRRASAFLLCLVLGGLADARAVSGHLSKVVLSVAFSGDGSRLAAARKGGPIYVWETATGKNAAAIRCAGCRPLRWGLALSPRGSLVVASNDPTLRSALVPSLGRLGHFNSLTVWEVRNPSLHLRISDFRPLDPESPFGIALSPDGKYLAAGELFEGPGPHLRIWEVSTGKLSRGFVRSALTVAFPQFSPDGRFVAAQPLSSLVPGRHAPPLAMWDLHSGKRFQTYSTCGPVLYLAFSPNGRTLAGENFHREVCMWDVSTGKAYAPLPVPLEPVVAVTFIGNDRLAAAVAGHQIYSWDLRSTRAVRECHAPELRSPAQFSPDGRMLAFGDATRPVVHLWDVQACKEIRTFNMQPDRK